MLKLVESCSTQDPLDLYDDRTQEYCVQTFEDIFETQTATITIIAGIKCASNWVSNYVNIIIIINGQMLKHSSFEKTVDRK